MATVGEGRARALSGGAAGLFWAAAALASWGAQAQGVAAPTAGATLERVREAAPDPARAPLPTAAVPGAPTPVAGLPPGERFTLRDVALEGATLFARDALEPFWVDRIGAEIGLAEAAEIAASVQAFYRAEGYVFTRVVAARPASRPDALRLIVVEARITAVSVEAAEGSLGPARALLERLAAPLLGLENPTLADLERVTLLMNDAPGVVRATVAPRPGEDGAGSVALTFNATRDVVSGALFLDTRQQPAFGEGVAGAFLEAGALGPGGETLSVTFSNTFWDGVDDFEERSILEAVASRHVGAYGTRAFLRLLGSRLRPGDALEPLDLEGREREIEFGVEHPAIRTRRLSLWARAGVEALDDRLAFRATGETVSEDRLRVFYVEAEALSRDPAGYSAATLGVRRGLDVFGASNSGDARLSRLDADPQAAVLYGSVEREQALAWGFALFGEAAGQVASAPLPGGEEFALGGTTFGRGYDPSQAVGDHGFGATIELRRREDFEIAARRVDAEVYGFGDFGRVWSAGDGVPAKADLASYGVGVRAFVEGALFIGAEIARPVEDLRRTNSDDLRFFVTAQRRF